jgi:AcrR family transcriptional regulator
VSTRDQLLTIATNLLAEKGYHGMTTAEIVQSAGVKKPTLYYHFKDKITLLQNILEANWAPFLALWEKGYSGDLPREIREKNQQIMSWAQARPQFLRAALALHWTPAGSEEGDSVIAPYRSKPLKAMIDFLVPPSATRDHGAITGRETLLARSYWGFLQVLFELGDSQESPPSGRGAGAPHPPIPPWNLSLNSF